MDLITSNFTTTTSAQTQLLETILQMHPIDTTFFTPQTFTYATIAAIWWLRIVCWYITTEDGGVMFQRILATEGEEEPEATGVVEMGETEMAMCGWVMVVLACAWGLGLVG
ncbi:hypothetical protein F5882DRAFT_373457 [Hyaloscypha sp. PMI_1271]|nr:hypothetical protein F5882DRAFT_373457 [Hyaloscypha sp. PMI_1271]